MMPEQEGKQPEEAKPPEIAMTNTKKEMLAAYKELLERLEEKRQAQLKPEQRVEEKRNKQAIGVADALSMDGIAKEIGTLKSEIGRTLSQLSDKLEEELGKHLHTKKAVELREAELREIYEIERAASSLTALLEAQKEKRESFEAEIAERKEELEYEIEATREEWEEEKATHEAECKERDADEKKRREREAQDFKYQSDRQRQLAKEDFEFEKAKLEREMQFKREELERDLAEREQAVAAREAELNQLRERVQAFPQELDAAIAKAVEETTARLRQEAQTSKELLTKDFEGERNVLTSRIESLQQTAKEQAQQIARLSAQIEKSYGQVQDIAVKAIEGSASVKALASMEARLAEQARRPAQGEA